MGKKATVISWRSTVILVTLVVRQRYGIKNVPRHKEENVHKHLVLMVVRGPKSGSESSEQRVQEQRAELIQKELQKKDEQIKSLQQQTTLLQQQAELLKERVFKLEVYTSCPPFEFTMTEFSKHKANNPHKWE